MSSNQNLPNAATSNAPGTPPPSNDNAARTSIPDTTPLVAHPDLVRHIRGTLRSYRVARHDMADAIADVQTEAIEAARTGRMPASLPQWKVLAATIAARWALDRRRYASVRKKYDAGLCEDPDAYARPTLFWEHRDPVDTKRYLAVLKDLFDSGQMPEHGAEILWGEAEGVPHEEIAAEIGVTRTVVDNRLCRMRVSFRARLAALGLLTLPLLLLAILQAAFVEGVSHPAPQTMPTEEGDAAVSEDGGVWPDARASLAR